MKSSSTAATDSLAFPPLPDTTQGRQTKTAAAAKPSSSPSFSPEKKSKRRSPKKNPASLAPTPTQSSNLRRTASRRRCPHFTRCGGCHYQHAAYEHQLEIKKEILRENLRRIAKLELQCEIQLHPSPPWNYRNRSRLQVRTQPNFAAGYFKFASHELLPVEECPISSPLINRGIAALWQSRPRRQGGEGVREVEFFANADSNGNETNLLLEFLCAPEARRAAVRAWAEELCAAMPEIAGVVAFARARKKACRSRWSPSAPRN